MDDEIQELIYDSVLIDPEVIDLNLEEYSITPDLEQEYEILSKRLNNLKVKFEANQLARKLNRHA